MCGRYTLSCPEEDILERFGVEESACRLTPRFNIAPSQDVPVIVQDGERRVLAAYNWGLVPFWAKDLKKTRPMINARAETLAEKPFFRQCLAKRRCLIPADGFYEWLKSGGKKTPIHVSLKGGSLFAFAGLWDEWRGPAGEVLRTCTIITTQANSIMAPVHARMPVIVRADRESLWLDPAAVGPAELAEILQPYDDGQMQLHAVSTRVNSPAAEGADLIEPVGAACHCSTGQI